jgi:ribonuclease HI
MHTKKPPEAVLYCDASVKEGYCGIGICLLDKNGNLLKKQARRLPSLGSNNTAAEASAVVEGIKLAQQSGFRHIRVYTDSKSLVNIAHRNSATTKIARQFLRTIQTLRRVMSISLRWVRGHAGQHWNCLCDRLARNARWSWQDLGNIIWNRLKGNWDCAGALT